MSRPHITEESGLPSDMLQLQYPDVYLCMAICMGVCMKAES